MFKTAFIEGRDIDEVWFKLLTELTQKGRKYLIDDGSFAGTHRLEFDYCAGTIHKPIDYSYEGVRKPLAVTVPPGIPEPTSEEKIENYFVNYIMDGNLAKNEHYRYSTFIVGGVYTIPQITINDVVLYKNFYTEYNKRIKVPNQLQLCIDHFKQAGFGNAHCCIQVGYPESLLAYSMSYKNEMDRQTSPCLRTIDCKIIKEEDGNYYLCLNVYFRSWDLWGGFPENLGGISLLMEYMANELGIKVGSLSFASKALHCYEFQLEFLKNRTGT